MRQLSQTLFPVFSLPARRPPCPSLFLSRLGGRYPNPPQNFRRPASRSFRQLSAPSTHPVPASGQVVLSLPSSPASFPPDSYSVSGFQASSSFRPPLFLASHRNRTSITDKMGYIDDEVKRLQGVIANLEGRVQALETKQFGPSSQKKTVEEVRAILIGPPGAGMLMMLLSQCWETPNQ